MGRAGGGSILAGGLQKLGDALLDYFGTLNEIEAGITVKMPEKPEALVLHELLQLTRLPVVSGGMIDQPHIWLMEEIAVDNALQLQERLKEIARRKNTPAPE